MTGRGYEGMNGEGGGEGWRVKDGLRDEWWGVRNVPLISLNAKLIISRNYENDNFRSHPTQRSASNEPPQILYNFAYFKKH